MISKSKIRDVFIDLLQQKIATLNKELEAVREAANSETKSSMGDKYETGREMMMQERNRLGGQLEVFADQLAAFNSIKLDKKYSKVSYGSMVQTSEVIFFLSTATGPLKIDGHSVFAISGEAPIAKTMIGKQVGDTFSFNNKSFTIKEIA